MPSEPLGLVRRSCRSLASAMAAGSGPPIAAIVSEMMLDPPRERLELAPPRGPEGMDMMAFLGVTTLRR